MSIQRKGQRMMTHIRCILLVGVSLVFGCESASWHREQVQDNTPGTLSVGRVQREIRVGMSSADVVEVLGSPNMVTTDDQRRESWVYDKVSTEVVYSTSSNTVGGGVGAGGVAGKALILGGGGAAHSSAAGAVSTQQKTLTIIIKFDNDGKVRDFAYHSSKF